MSKNSRKSWDAKKSASPKKHGEMGLHVSEDFDKNLTEKENINSSPKMNAFEFMMHSRNKSLGRNSPGRELDLSRSPENGASKTQRKVRRSRLENWAASKGSAKRKRDEEVGKIIEQKLAKRGKKLKKILNIDCQSDDEVIVKRRKKCVVIDSDSETSDQAWSQSERKKSKLSLNKTGELTPKAIKLWKFKIKLSMDACVNREEKEKEIENGGEKTKIDADAEVGQKLTSEDELESEEEVIIYEDESNSGTGSLKEIKKSNEIENTNGKIMEKETNIEEANDSVLVIEDSPNDGKRVLRARRHKPKKYEDFLSDEDTPKRKKKTKRDVLSDEEETPKSKNKLKKDVKVAPVFLKSLPKPKLDPELVEARRQFLLSGVPSSLKKEMERQQCSEEVDFDVFPTISHIQQKSLNNQFWDLAKVELKVQNEIQEKIQVEPFPTKLFAQNFSDQTPVEKLPLKKIKHFKKIVNEIKSNNPDYPVFKVFNTIYEKSGYKTVKTEDSPASKRRGRKKKKPEAEVSVNIQNIENPALWTEKYKPNSSTDIIGNHNSVLALKEWLKNWLNSPKSLRKNRSDSESEFDTTDGDSRDSAKLLGNTVILRGPTGSGKTAAIYAVCNELGLDVLEVNASSKRTGKRLQQELQEATQSHQVCKKETFLSSFVKDTKEKRDLKKMCVLLIEDIDVVFEQDEGFSAALSQIITTSKRPVFLTTTDEPNNGIQKLLNNYRTIHFFPLSSILSVWLQIVCLVEGMYVDVRALDELLRFHRGDIRRTLLQLQLYVTSGGKTTSDKEIESGIHIDNAIKMDDDGSNLSYLKLDETENQEVQIHGDCLDSCYVVTDHQTFSLPHCTDLEIIWWNFPSILNTSNVDKISKEKLKMLSQCYDSMGFADVMCGRGQFHDSLKPKWRTKVKDSLELEEIRSSYIDKDFCNDLAHTLLSRQLGIYKDRWENSRSRLNLVVPHASERRLRAKQHSSENKLQEALLESDSLCRKAISLDYLPSLRSIARSEFQRAANNSKRGNRFYSYLRSLGLRGSDCTYKIACDVFQL